MAILVLQMSVRGQNRSEFQQEHSCDNTKVKQNKMDASKLKKQPLQVKKVSKTFFSPSLEVLTILPSISMAWGSIIHWPYVSAFFKILIMAQGRCASGTFRPFPEPSGTFRPFPEPSGTYSTFQEPLGPCLNLQEPLGPSLKLQEDSGTFRPFPEGSGKVQGRA